MRRVVIGLVSLLSLAQAVAVDRDARPLQPVSLSTSSDDRLMSGRRPYGHCDEAEGDLHPAAQVDRDAMPEIHTTTGAVLKSVSACTASTVTETTTIVQPQDAITTMIMTITETLTFLATVLVAVTEIGPPGGISSSTSDLRPNQAEASTSVDVVMVISSGIGVDIISLSSFATASTDDAISTYEIDSSNAQSTMLSPSSSAPASLTSTSLVTSSPLDSTSTSTSLVSLAVLSSSLPQGQDAPFPVATMAPSTLLSSDEPDIPSVSTSSLSYAPESSLFTTSINLGGLGDINATPTVQIVLSSPASPPASSPEVTQFGPNAVVFNPSVDLDSITLTTAVMLGPLGP